MAESAKGDWTAGLLAIAAAVMIGGALPIGLWFGLYQPKLKERESLEIRHQELQTQFENLNRQMSVVTALEADGQTMAERLAVLEAPYHEAEQRRNDVPTARALLNALAEEHRLAPPEEVARLGHEVVRPGSRRIRWRHGLSATQLMIHATGTFHDFARFVTDMENLGSPEATESRVVVIPDLLICQGDSSAGVIHTFMMTIYVVESRNIDEIGSRDPGT
jgi:Tfp pilus assembly protein PilO